jgi:hypothetical protein
MEGNARTWFTPQRCIDQLNPPHKADIPRLSSNVRFRG